jgi:hypothetical protein
MMATTAILTVLGVGIYLLTQEDSNALVKTNNRVTIFKII